ncbi:unnamed protein product [Mytilus coruscus]|uniref:Uncharacterized protein n=1 Tax=Mytilus coruscus TaxID=42192 RepID=A0A6J7ZVJ8_MYTCO|nr:unnamed protein product [Mytilus coruscus]
MAQGTQFVSTTAHFPHETAFQPYKLPGYTIYQQQYPVSPTTQIFDPMSLMYGYGLMSPVIYPEYSRQVYSGLSHRPLEQHRVLQIEYLLQCVLSFLFKDSKDDINLEDDEGNTNDDNWCISIRPHVVRLLVAKGVHVNEVDTSGCTALHKVITQYNQLNMNNPQRADVRHLYNLISIISILLSNGVDLSMRDKEGKTARDDLEEFKLSDVQAMIDKRMTPEDVNEGTVSSIIYNMYKGSHK